LRLKSVTSEDNYAGFPVGGSFLMTENPELTKLHQQKVYGQASVDQVLHQIEVVETNVGHRQYVAGGGGTQQIEERAVAESLWSGFSRRAADVGTAPGCSLPRW
jgi:hypothetical protein